MTDEEREQVRAELAHARDELYLILTNPPEHTHAALMRWRSDLKRRRREIARLEGIEAEPDVSTVSLNDHQVRAIVNNFTEDDPPPYGP